MTSKETISQSLVNSINSKIEKGDASKLPAVIWDTKTTGFAIHIGKTGASYKYKYRNKAGLNQTKTFCKTTNCSVAEARDLVNAFIPTIKQDKFTEQKIIKKITVEDICKKYLAEHDMRESTRKVDASRINRHVLPIIGKIPLSLLTADDIKDLQTAIATGDKRIVIAGHKNPNNPHSYIKVTGGEGVAKRTMEMLKTILNFAEDQGLISENPMNTRKFKKIKHVSKETPFLEPEDYKKLGMLLRKYELKQKGNKIPQSVLFIKLVALTGCRKNELLGLKWDQVNFANQYFAFTQTKTTEEQNRVFGSAAKDLLEEMYKNKTSDYLFPSITKAGDHRQDCLKALKQVCKTNINCVKDFDVLSKLTLHGLRHSFATRCNDLDFSDVQIEGLLGHKKGDVEGKYARNRSEKMVEKADIVSKSINDLLNDGYVMAEQEQNN